MPGLPLTRQRQRERCSGPAMTIRGAPSDGPRARSPHAPALCGFLAANATGPAVSCARCVTPQPVRCGAHVSSCNARSAPLAGAVASPSAAPAAGSFAVTCGSMSSHSALRVLASDATGESVGELAGPAPLPAIPTALRARPLARTTRGVAPSLAARRPRGPLARGILPVADLTCAGSPVPNASSAARNRSACSESSSRWRSMLIRSPSILTIMEEYRLRASGAGISQERV